ncbi:hypothetical protein TTRE_0000608701 [Trichuris trichiura]|uniref:Uncharacterized protein n=1 Tax=Trichuris trichiura TaxID=36087 RepID=A0A077ZBP2_TRITR|nr:hypothetical protein TTRE_0000608701 [Trichuris trichiura]
MILSYWLAKVYPKAVEDIICVGLPTLMDDIMGCALDGRDVKPDKCFRKRTRNRRDHPLEYVVLAHQKSGSFESFHFDSALKISRRAICNSRNSTDTSALALTSLSRTNETWCRFYAFYPVSDYWRQL